ncbi:RNA exonuclease [Vairimorpha necatrix]|uniref:RNA exonuclease n=1 Tax=Vairimorpha necatrix TaxID=6039 RepID=A0AAX4JA76_9MICR
MSTEAENLKRYKLNDIYRILNWIFNNKKRPQFFPVKSKDKPFSLNFIFISDYKENEFVLPTLCKLKFHEKLNFNDLPFNLTRECNIRQLLPDYSVIKKENLDLVFHIKIEQLYDNKIFINSDVNLKCPNKQNVFTKSTPYFLISLDIEMVTTKIGKEVGRISLIDNLGNVLYDKYVKPINQVINYETEYSGLTKEILDDGIENYQMIQEISEFIGKDTVVLGHGLENDFTSLGMYHDKIIDTSYLFLSTQSRRVSLQQLSRTYLKIQIQNQSHCSIIDATTCLKLLSLKIQEMLIIQNKESERIKFHDKILYHNGYEEFMRNHAYGLNICRTKSGEVKKNINGFYKKRTLTFYWYEEENKIKLEF